MEQGIIWKLYFWLCTLVLQSQEILEWLEWEGTLKVILFHPTAMGRDTFL